MADQPNVYGTLPIIFTPATNTPYTTTRQRNKFFNNLWINPNTTSGWSGSNNFYFANNGTAAASNGTPVKLSSTADNTFSWKSLLPTAPSGSNGNGNPLLYSATLQPGLQTAITNWLKNKNIGTKSGQINPAGLNFLWFTGGRINLGTSQSAAQTGADTPANLQSGNDAYFFVEPFIGTQAGDSTSDNFADFSYIDAFNGGVDLIPWFYDPGTSSLITSSQASGGLKPIYSVQAGKDSSFSGSTVQDAAIWLQNNILPMNTTNGSAVFPFQPAYSGAPFYMRLNQPEYATQLVYDTNQPSSGKIYYHNFAQYLYYLQENYSTLTNGQAGFNAKLPWLTNSTNNGAGYGYQIYNVVLNGFSDGSQGGSYSTGATVDLYCAPTSQINAWLSGTPVNNQNATKITLFWDDNNPSYQSGVNTLSSAGNGIYGANPGFMLTTFDASGNASPGGYVDSLGVSTNTTWIVGDFLAALNYGMPLGKFPAAYSATINGTPTNFNAGDYIPPQLWLTQTSGLIGDNIFSKNGWAFAKIQTNPNFYNQYAYGISQVATNDYGWAYTDRMQQSVGVNPNPFTYNTPPSIQISNDEPSSYTSPQVSEQTSQGTYPIENTSQPTAASGNLSLLYFTDADLAAIQELLSSGSVSVSGQAIIASGTTVSSVTTAASLGSANGTGYVTLSQAMTGGIGSNAPITFQPASANLLQVNFTDADLAPISKMLKNGDVVAVTGPGVIPANTTVASVTTAASLGKADGTGYVTLSQRMTGPIGAAITTIFTPSGGIPDTNDKLFFSNADLQDLITGLPTTSDTYLVSGQNLLSPGTTVGYNDIILGTGPKTSTDWTGGYVQLSKSYTNAVAADLPFSFTVNSGTGLNQPFVFLEASIHQPPRATGTPLALKQKTSKLQTFGGSSLLGRKQPKSGQQARLRGWPISSPRSIETAANQELEPLLGKAFGVSNPLTGL